MFYGQLDESNICVGISQLNGLVKSDSMIELVNYDISLLGKQYQNGEWITLPKEEVEKQPIDKTEILMQTLADIEINILNAQQERQLLAQQLTDIELSHLSGGETNV